jgi:hypothetical protein
MPFLPKCKALSSTFVKYQFKGLLKRNFADSLVAMTLHSISNLFDWTKGKIWTQQLKGKTLSGSEESKSHTHLLFFCNLKHICSPSLNISNVAKIVWISQASHTIWKWEGQCIGNGTNHTLCGLRANKLHPKNKHLPSYKRTIHNWTLLHYLPCLIGYTT